MDRTEILASKRQKAIALYTQRLDAERAVTRLVAELKAAEKDLLQFELRAEEESSSPQFLLPGLAQSPVVTVAPAAPETPSDPGPYVPLPCAKCGQSPAEQLDRVLMDGQMVCMPCYREKNPPREQKPKAKRRKSPKATKPAVEASEWPEGSLQIVILESDLERVGDDPDSPLYWSHDNLDIVWHSSERTSDGALAVICNPLEGEDLERVRRVLGDAGVAWEERALNSTRGRRVPARTAAPVTVETPAEPPSSECVQLPPTVQVRCANSGWPDRECFGEKSGASLFDVPRETATEARLCGPCGEKASEAPAPRKIHIHVRRNLVEFGAEGVDSVARGIVEDLLAAGWRYAGDPFEGGATKSEVKVRKKGQHTDAQIYPAKGTLPRDVADAMVTAAKGMAGCVVECIGTGVDGKAWAAKQRAVQS